MTTAKAFGWLLAVRGILALALGVVALFWPLPALTVGLTLIAAYALLDGAYALAATIVGRASPWSGLLRTVIGLGCGAVILLRPELGVVGLVSVAAAWAVLSGGLELSAGLRMKRAVPGTPWLILAGGLSLLFGGALVFKPLAGAIVLAWVVGAYAFAAGVMLLGLAGSLLGRIRRGEEPAVLAIA